MQRGKMTLPLLIGGATTSPQHTASRIAPDIHSRPCTCPDRSRVVERGRQLLKR
jgi:5-methyltetrahydrofolate--homocysteine methyltransferase